MNCAFCGKAIRLREKDCPYCGTPIPEAPAAEGVDASEWLDRIRELEESLRHKPSARRTIKGLSAICVVGFAFVSVGGWFLVDSRNSGEPLVVQLFLLLFVLAGVPMIVGGILGLLRLAASRVQRVPAVIVDKREELPDDDGSSITYYVSIKTADGQSKDHIVPHKLFQELEKGDAGIAFFKGFFLDFKRVRLPKT